MRRRTTARHQLRVRIRTRVAAPAILALLAGTPLTGGTAHAAAPRASVSGSGITVTVNTDGSYQTQTSQPAPWVFSGSVGHTVTSQNTAGPRGSLRRIQGTGPAGV